MSEDEGHAVLLDTDILVDHLRGQDAAKTLLLNLIGNGFEPAVSVVTVAEIEAGVLPPEREAVESLLAGVHTLPADEETARKAGRYRAHYGRSHGVLLPDAFVAAAAWRDNLPLYTLNRKHYPMDDIEIVIPY